MLIVSVLQFDENTCFSFSNSFHRQNVLISLTSFPMHERFSSFWDLEKKMKHICKKYTFFNLNLLRQNKRLTKGLGSLRAEIFLEKIFTELTFAVSAINDENKFRETYKILKNRENPFHEIWWSFNSKKQTSLNHQ